MNYWEGIRLAWSSIKSNKLRSLLTALGIIFGVGAVVGLVSIGQGATKDISDRITNMGSHLITVTPNRATGAALYIEDAQDLMERVSTISDAVPFVIFNSVIKGTNKTHSTSVEGATVGYFDLRNIKIEIGRPFTSAEIDDRQRVALIGKTVSKELFEERSPLGEKILVKGQYFDIIGILEERGSNMGRDNDDLIIIPVTVAQRLSGSKQIGTIYLKAKGTEEAKLAVAHVTAIYNQKFKRENTVRVTSQDELLTTISTTTRTLTIMLGAIAGISLVVGGIGIMNIMLVSVTERTKEIGIRKALGAKRKDIMGQFLVESVLLSVSGGLIGILLGVGLSKAVSVLAQWTTVISSTAIIISFLFALGIGLFFGVYPAYKAANLDPIVALRND